LLTFVESVFSLEANPLQMDLDAAFKRPAVERLVVSHSSRLAGCQSGLHVCAMSLKKAAVVPQSNALSTAMKYGPPTSGWAQLTRP